MSFHPPIGRTALLDDPMKGEVPLVVAKFSARAHHRNQNAARFQKAEGMADNAVTLDLFRASSPR